MTTLKQIKPLFSFTKKHSRPILHYVRVTNSTIEATDLETSIVLFGNYGLTPGLHKYGTLEHNIAKDDDSDYPIINNSIACSESFLFDADRLKFILPFTSNDETRMYLTCLAIDKGHFVACDGHTLKYYKLPKENKETYLIPNTALKHLERLLKKFKLKHFEFEMSQGHAIVRNDCFEWKAVLLQRDYVSWQSIIPTNFNKTLQLTDLPSFKEIKGLLNPRTFAVAIESEQGIINLKFPNFPEKNWPIGTCPRDFKFEIGFNYSYLERATNGANSAKLQVNDALKPASINEAIVMPLRL